jgi:iron complex outermembrane receptor protein
MIRRFSMHARLMTAAAVSALCAAPALAEGAAEASAAAEPDVITVTSTPLRLQSDEVVGSVTVLGEDALIELLDGNIADTLDALPGVSSSYFGPASGRPIIRGLGDDRVRVLINGIDAIDASASSPDHAVAAEVLGARGVEVLRGPAAIAYGGGAIGGVVNILDGRIPTARVDGPLDGFVYAGATSVDEGTQLAGRVSAGAGPLVFQLDAVRREAEGFDIPGFAETEALREEHHHDEHEEDHDHDEDHGHEEEEPEFGQVEDAFYTFESVSGAMSLVEDWGFVGLSVKGVDAEYGLPGHSHAHGHDEDHDEDHGDDHDHDEDHDHDHDHGHEHGEEEGPAVLVMEQTRVDLRGEVNFDRFFNRLRWSVAHVDYQHAELEGDEIGTLFDKEGAEARIELAHDHDGARQGAFGVQALTQDFEAQGEEAYIEAVTTQDWGAFLVERWDFGAWGIEAGARAETRKMNGLRAERSFDTLSGSAALFARPGERSFVSVTLSRTERAPTDVEVFAFGPHAATETFEIGDLNLGTETAWSLEATGRWTGERVFGEASVFHAAYDGFIGLFPTGAEEDGLDVYEYRQADADLTGFEVSGGVDLGAFAGFDLSADAAVDYVRAELDGGGDLPRIPPLSGLIGLEAERGIWSARAEARLVAEQDEVAAFETATDGYALLNAQLTARPFAGRDVALIVGVRNITDEEARVHTSFLKDQVPLPGRNVRFAIRAGF